MIHRIGVTSLGLGLLVVGVLAGLTSFVEYYDPRSMLTASATYAGVVLVPGMLGWGLLKRHELARRVAVVVFASLGLLVAVLGLVLVGLSLRVYRSLLTAAVFLVIAAYLDRDVVRNQFVRKDVQPLSLS